MNIKHPSGVFRTYGTKSIKYLYAIEHLGAKLVESNIQCLGPGNLVRFENGKEEEFDIVLLNTGYKKSSFEGFCIPGDDKILSKVLSEASYVRNLYKRVSEAHALKRYTSVLSSYRLHFHVRLSILP